MNTGDIKEAILLFVVPAIPGIFLWLCLDPSTFWQKLATIIIAVIIYIAVFGLVVNIKEG